MYSGQSLSSLLSLAPHGSTEGTARNPMNILSSSAGVPSAFWTPLITFELSAFAQITSYTGYHGVEMKGCLLYYGREHAIKLLCMPRAWLNTDFITHIGWPSPS